MSRKTAIKQRSTEDIDYSQQCLLVGWSMLRSVWDPFCSQRQASKDQQECKNVLFREATFDPVIEKSNTALQPKIQIAMIILILIIIVITFTIITTTIIPPLSIISSIPQFDNTHALESSWELWSQFLFLMANLAHQKFALLLKGSCQLHPTSNCILDQKITLLPTNIFWASIFLYTNCIQLGSPSL